MGYAFLTGSSTNRPEEIARFNHDPKIQAFLISLKAGGVGLNLTQADYVFIIDPWWNRQPNHRPSPEPTVSDKTIR